MIFVFIRQLSFIDFLKNDKHFKTYCKCKYLFL
uniref:Uncharacterized protein n=1 Tax=Anguilla anguilla TaxID=7936 RepID=A0A0E9R8H7_ANGAN